MQGTSEPLTPEFFINPQCPPVAVPVEAVVAPKTGVSKGVEHSPNVGAEVGDNSACPPGVAEEREGLDTLSES